ncbi:MAG: MOSC domain-containing protein [Prolixibacteraceae bacterium]|jgi:MOSC domain-containing protein YiiM|nr:MOSC domain-containing protein [Prolixibacteraceae bacterium]
MARIVSTNIGEKVSIVHQGKEVKTGIYKYAFDTAIYLGKTDVQTDNVVDRKYHGGIDKACYLYPSENYKYWQQQFPNLKMEWGMFGENLTTEGLLESEIHIGSVYRIGETFVQVTQPRQPCYKLGIRFKDSKVVKLFSNSPYPGIYVRVLREGLVRTDDSIELLDNQIENQTLTEVFELLMKRNKDEQLINRAINTSVLAESARKDLIKILNLGVE